MTLAEELAGKAPRVALRGSRRTIISAEAETPEQRERRERLEAYRARKVAWHTANKAHVANYRAKWAGKNPEKLRAQRQRYRQNHLAQHRDYQAKYARDVRAAKRFIAAILAYLGATSC